MASLGYEMISNGGREYFIDWDLVHRLVKGYWTARLQYDLGRDVSTSEAVWYNPGSWGLPDIVSVDVDWDKVRSRAAEQSAKNIADYRTAAKFNVPLVVNRLTTVLEDTRRYKELMLGWMGQIQTDNITRVEQSVNHYESVLAAVKLLRDVSAEGVMIGATIMTAGVSTVTVAGLMGTGAVLKGVAKFQDTENSPGASPVLAGVLEGTGSLLFGFIKLKKMNEGKELMMALAQGLWKTDTELAAGDTVGDSLVSGGVKMVGTVTADRVFKTAAVKKLLKRVPVPVWLTVPGGGPDAKKYPEKVAKKLLEKGVGKAANAAIGAARSSGDLSPRGTGLFAPPNPANTAATRLSFVTDATFTQDLLLYLAVVDMQEGIGRGFGR